MRELFSANAESVLNEVTGMSDLRGIGRSVEELLALKEGAAGGSALPSIRKKAMPRAFEEGEMPDIRQDSEEVQIVSYPQKSETTRILKVERYAPKLGGSSIIEERRFADEVASKGMFSTGSSGIQTSEDVLEPESGRKPQREFKSFEAELLFAKEKALRLLGDMDRTKKELSERLARGGVGEEAIRKTMEYLERYNYLDDARYARHYYARFRAERGARRIRLELMKKGIDKETLIAVLSEEDDANAENEKTRCAALAKKRAAGQNLSDPKALSRLVAYLARRGFREADIWAAVREIAENKENKEGKDDLYTYRLF